MADEYRHRDYRAWLLSQPCCCQPCVASVIIHHHTSGRTEQHGKSAPGRRGKGQRASDADGMPLCHHHHADLHDRTGLSGYFELFDRSGLRSWQDAQVERLTRLYGMAHPEPIQPERPLESPARARHSAASSPEHVQWTVPRVLTLLRREAAQSHRTADAAAALNDVADLVEGKAL